MNGGNFKMKKYELLKLEIKYFTEDIITGSPVGEKNQWGIGELPFSDESNIMP
jgi:hypothetical protein